MFTHPMFTVPTIPCVLLMPSEQNRELCDMSKCLRPFKSRAIYQMHQNVYMFTKYDSHAGSALLTESLEFDLFSVK